MVLEFKSLLTAKVDMLVIGTTTRKLGRVTQSTPTVVNIAVHSRTELSQAMECFCGLKRKVQDSTATAISVSGRMV